MLIFVHKMKNEIENMSAPHGENSSANTKLIHGGEDSQPKQQTLPPLDEASCSASSFDWRNGMPQHLIEKLESEYNMYGGWKDVPPHLTPRYMGKDKNGKDKIGFFSDAILEVSSVIG